MPPREVSVRFAEAIGPRVRFVCPECAGHLWEAALDLSLEIQKIRPHGEGIVRRACEHAMHTRTPKFQAALEAAIAQYRESLEHIEEQAAQFVAEEETADA